MPSPLWKRNVAQDSLLFENVHFLIEATSCEQHMLWREYHGRPQPDMPTIKVWEEESRGHLITIGMVLGKPVCCSIFYATLDGIRVAFYEATSQLVDHEMIDKWLRYHTEKKIRWDAGTRWAQTDAQNFHHCLHFVQEKAA